MSALKLSANNFPSPADLRGQFPDQLIDAATYNYARQLFEARPLTVSLDYHLRACVTAAICQRKISGEFISSSQGKADGTARF